MGESKDGESADDVSFREKCKVPVVELSRLGLERHSWGQSNCDAAIEFERLLVKRSNKNKRSVIDDYGANPAEFFAVATETFYEKPKQLESKHPALFEVLTKYYGVNSLEWD